MDFDDLVVFPFNIPSSRLNGLFTQHNIGAWANSPFVTVTGDFLSANLGDGSFTALVTTKETPYVQLSDGEFRNNNRTLTFTLRF